MATHRVPIHQFLNPNDDTVQWVPYTLLATNDQWNHLVLGFGDIGDATQPAGRLEAYGSFDVPENYVGTAVFRIRWNTTKTTGNVVWDMDYRAVGGDDTESLDQTTQSEQVTVTDAAGSAAHERCNVTISLTSANFAAGDTVTFHIARDGVDASDTLAGMAMLHGLYFEYADA